jgi:hypothetical protein
VGWTFFRRKKLPIKTTQLKRKILLVASKAER